MQTDRLSQSAFQTAKMKAVHFQKKLQVLGANKRDCSLAGVGLTCCCVVLHTFCV